MLMTDESDHLATGSGPFTAGQRSVGTSNLRVSSQIARYLAIAVVAFALVALGFAVWMTREHNRLAASASEQMVRGGISTLHEKLQTITMDYAIWPEAINAINEHNLVWLWDNIGVSAAVTETTDLMIIMPARGGQPYGWVPGMGEEPSEALMDAELIQRMRALLDTVPKAERRAVSTFTKFDGKVWLLSSARLVSDDPEEDPADDADIPRLIFGDRLTSEQMNELGLGYLIDDLALNGGAHDDKRSIPLADETGRVVAEATWTPPRPGDQILRAIAVPLAISLIVVTLIALIAARLLTRSAQRLEATMLTAQAASRAKSDFIANVSHELRTPMNGVIGLASLLRNTQLTEAQKEMVEMLQSSANAQMHLIGDLLDISRIENGQFSLSVAPFSPGAVVDSTCKLFELSASKKSLEFSWEINEPEDLEVLGDKERFRQVCANVISNAIKFTQSGAVKVRMTTRDHFGEAVMLLEVSDTGRGIVEADRQRIFQRFAQGQVRGAGKDAGIGLGLAIAKTIVDMMGGSITVESRPGQGSTFRVEIGFASAERETETSQAQAGA